MADPKLVAELEEKAKMIRRNIVEMIGDTRRGHLGGSLSIADIVAVLYYHTMRLRPGDPSWEDRDRFLLSKGHAALAQYAALIDLGYIPKEELYKLKDLGSMTQGHPDMRKTPGIEAGTGSLGQGLSVAVGMALGLRLAGKDSKVYVIVGDGELNEGQIWEAAMAAAHYEVDNLVAFLDYNGLQATGCCAETMRTEPLPEKWAAFGWHVINIDGHDIGQILDALDEAAAVREKPVMIVAKTVKGKGVSFAENVAGFHHGEMTTEQYKQALAELA
ncbi:MAG: transketolase [Firmicutes bacterium]|jgi:transketolase|nr:transketolase [Bacillota bacterium]